MSLLPLGVRPVHQSPMPPVGASDRRVVIAMAVRAASTAKVTQDHIAGRKPAVIADVSPWSL
jgi:hypothetical protein